MLVLVASDVHSDVGAARLLVRSAELHNADLLVVTGDACSPAVIKEIASYRSFYVSGNMDDSSVIKEARRRGILLDGRVAQVKEFTFVGMSVSEELPNARVEERWVLLTHYPPKDSDADVAYSGRHVGSYVVRKVIEDMRPVACFCGHIHESPTISKLGETLIVNPGPAYRRRAVLVDLGELKAQPIKLVE